MPIWLAPLDPHETKKYQAQFKGALGSSEVLTGTPSITLPSSAISAGLQAATPTIINDPDDATANSAVEVTFSVAGGSQDNTTWNNAGQTYPVIVSCGTDGGQTLEQAFNLTVKQAGSPAITWSYDPALSSDRDWVRFEIDDTDQADQLVMDQTIDALLTSEGSVLDAAARVAQHLHAKFSREVTVSAEGALVKLSDLSEKYRKLSLDLQRRSASTSVPAPVVSGLSKSENAAVRADSDRAVSGMRPGLHDNPDACW